MHPSDVKKKKEIFKEKERCTLLFYHIYIFSFEWSVVVERYFMKNVYFIYTDHYFFFYVNYQNMLYVHRTHGKGCIDVHVRISKICDKILNKSLVKPTRSENAFRYLH